MGGIKIMVSWGELHSYRVVWRGKNELGVEQELLEIVRSE